MAKPGICSNPGCGGVVVAKGLCGKHYYHLTKTCQLRESSQILEIERRIETLTSGKAARKGATKPNRYNDKTIAEIEKLVDQIHAIRKAIQEIIAT